MGIPVPPSEGTHHDKLARTSRYEIDVSYKTYLGFEDARDVRTGRIRTAHASGVC